jgi:hypothetical protein
MLGFVSLIRRSAFVLIVSLVIQTATFVQSANAFLTFDCSTITKPHSPEVAEDYATVLRDLPDGSALKICPLSYRAGTVYIFSPVQKVEDVWLYTALIYANQPDNDVDLNDIVSVVSADPIAEFIMMALADDETMKHSDRRFVETNLISIGQFRIFHSTWSRFVKDRSSISLNWVGTDSTAHATSEFQELEEAIEKAGDAGISMIGLYPDEELGPRYEVQINVGLKTWSLLFDISEVGNLDIYRCRRLVP